MAKAKKPGPRPKKKREKLNRRSFTCTDPEWKALEKIAYAKGLSSSEVIRSLIRGFIEGHEGDE